MIILGRSIKYSGLILAGIVASAAAIATPAHAQRLQLGPQSITVTEPAYRLTIDLSSGKWSAAWPMGAGDLKLTDVSSNAALQDGRSLDTATFASHACAKSDIRKISDHFGKGIEIVVHHRSNGLPELRQAFDLYPRLPYFLNSVTLFSPALIASNHITVVSCDSSIQPNAGATLDQGDAPQTLSVPYDNDAFVRYSSSGNHTSYEVTAFYDNASRHGFVFGSVTHDTWKTGITFDGVAGRHVGKIDVFGGIADKQTRDTQPHGYVTGALVKSPTILVGGFSEWRQGLEDYGRANAKLHPPLAWNGGVPFGWNSWMAYGTKINEAVYLGVSDFFKKSLVPQSFSDKGVVYINFDAFWDNMNDAQLKAAIAHVHANGQKAGFYWTPFVCWGNNLGATMEGTNNAYKYSDAVMRDSSGNPLPMLDGGYPLDPSAPGTLARIDGEIARFVGLGIDYIKLDFLSHGAMEGKRHDPHVQTGEQAYAIGMQRIDDDLSKKKVGRPIFISLSIAPLFPSGYGNSRRIACDTWGWLANSEYLLNSLTYGWWEEGPLYRFNDPDNIELIERSPPTTEMEGQTRFNASVISGTVLLDSDPLVDTDAQARALKYLTNPEINALGRMGHAFHPVDGNTGVGADDTFVYHDHAGATYVAVFNFSGKTSKAMRVDLSRIGLNASALYHIHDLWSHTDRSARGSVEFALLPAQSTIVRLTPIGDSYDPASAK
jgi:alpha-galactosidase